VDTIVTPAYKRENHGRRGMTAAVAAALTALVVLLIVCPAVARAGQKIAIVSIDDESSTLRTIKGIKQSFARSGLTVEYNEATLSGHPDIDTAIVKNLRDFDPELFITVGSYATSAISANFPQRPIIFAAVINPMASGFVKTMYHPGGRITGAALDIPADIQFKYFQRVVGDIRRMGVIYSSETENVIRQAEIAARALGIKLISVKIKSEKEIPGAIDSLCKVSDALWSVADHIVYTPQSTRHIILQTLRNRMPMMAFSQSLVESGGLFTLDFDFKDIGRQAGEIARRVLRGDDPAKIPVSTPGVIYFKYNEKTANQIAVSIPEDLLAIAKEVIK
jgi:putative ABC transport system substrate-binding protein